MPRSLYRDTVMVKGPAGAIPLAGAAVAFYLPGDGTPIGYPLYPDGTSTTPLTLPYVTGILGELEVWADAPHRVRVVVTKGGLTQADETIDLEYPPEYSASTGDVTDAVAAHEAKPDPHLQYLTEARGDLRYLPLGTPIPDAYTKTQSDARYEPLDSAYTKPESDGRYQGLSLLGQPNGYPPLDANGLLPTTYLPPLAITDTFVATSEAQMLALTAQRGDVCVRADEAQTYILAADPATVLANWVELASSAVSGTATVLDQQEFAPAAAATTVTLAAVPTDVLEVSRNGVAQSLAAGHYTVAGAVVTFTDAFAAGERVAVLYAVGTSVVTDAYTKGQSDSRYEPLDSAYTKTESDSRYAPAGAGGAVDSVNGQVGVVVLAASDVGALTQATADTRYEPFDSAYTKVEADARYQAAGSYLTQATADIRYLQISNAFTQTLADARYPLKTDVDPYTVYYNQTRGDARYLQTANAFTQTLADARYLRLIGGSLTGALNLTGAAGTDRVLNFQTAGSGRWGWIINNAAESGANAGSDLVLNRFSDAAAYLGTAMSIVRATGAMNFETAPNWAGSPALNQSAGDARYPQLTGGSVMTGLLGPTTNNTRDLGTTALRWAKLWAVNAEFTNPPSYGGAAQPKITVNVSAPGSPATGDLWVW